jgi:hypothetical protein
MFSNGMVCLLPLPNVQNKYLTRMMALLKQGKVVPKDNKVELVFTDLIQQKHFNSSL